MNIKFKKSFEKQYEKLSKLQKEKVDTALTLFIDDYNNPILKNHELQGKLKGKRSISAAHDLRLIFSEENNYLIVNFLATGSHNQVY